MSSCVLLSHHSRALKHRGFSVAVLATIGLSLSISVGAFAQTPPTNYATLVFPSPNPNIAAIDKADSTSAVLSGGTHKVSIGAFLAFTAFSDYSTGPIGISGPWVVLNRIFSTSDIYVKYGARVQKVGSPYIDLSGVATPQMGSYHPTTANAIDGTTIGGYWDRSTRNNQPIRNAAIWYLTGTQWKYTDLHQASQLNSLFGPNSESEVYGISHDSSSALTTGVGFGGGADRKAKPLRWEGTDGNFTVKILDTSPLGTADVFGIAIKSDEETTVGMGYGSLTGAREPGNNILSWPFLRHAMHWAGTQATDLHAATNLNSLLGAQAESNCLDVANDIIVGYGQGANNGPKILLSPPATNRYYYPARALRWTKNSDGSFSATSLSQFLPAPAPSTGVEDYANSVTTDGSILGFRQTYDAQSNYTAQNTVLWKPLATDTSHSLTVPLEAKAYIMQPFTQSGGTTQVYGELLLGASNTGTLTLNSGSITIDGVLRGRVDINSGSFSTAGTVVGNVTLSGGYLSGIGAIQGTVVNNGGTITPGKNGGVLQPVTDPLTITGSFKQNSGILRVTANNGLSVTGMATLGGALVLGGKGLPAPTVGTTVTVLTCGSVRGMFTSIPAGWTLTGVTTGTFPQRVTVKAVYTGTSNPR